MKYEYGVEYETNGKKPDLPDDVLVEYYGRLSQHWRGADIVADWNWNYSVKFRIVDKRYKPVENESDMNKQVFIEAPMFKGLTDEKSWHVKDGLPPVGWHGEVTWGCKTSWHECVILPDNRIAYYNILDWVVNDVRNLELAEFRPIKSDREKFVEAALLSLEHYFEQGDYQRRIIDRLYDAGCRFTENKAAS